MTLLAIGLAWILAGAALAALVRVHRDIESLKERPDTASQPPYDDTEVRNAIEALAGLYDDLDSRVGDLFKAVAEGIEHVDRSERRVKAAIQRAKRRLDAAGFEDEGVEAEAEALRANDADRRRVEGVSPVPTAVASPGDRFAAFPGAWDGF